MHVPLAHGLGFDALAAQPCKISDRLGKCPEASSLAQAHNGSVNERITPSLENRALRLYFPEEYSMIEAGTQKSLLLLGAYLGRFQAFESPRPLVMPTISYHVVRDIWRPCQTKQSHQHWTSLPGFYHLL